jgi:hypothetical protein
MRMQVALAAFVVLASACPPATASSDARFETPSPPFGWDFGLGIVESPDEPAAPEQALNRARAAAHRLIDMHADWGRYGSTLRSISEEEPEELALEELLRLARRLASDRRYPQAAGVYAEILRIAPRPDEAGILSRVKESAEADLDVWRGKRGLCPMLPIFLREWWASMTDPMALLLAGVPGRAAGIARGLAEARRAGLAARAMASISANVGTRTALARLRGAENPVELGLIGYGTSLLVKPFPSDYQPFLSKGLVTLYKQLNGQLPAHAALRSAGLHGPTLFSPMNAYRSQTSPSHENHESMGFRMTSNQKFGCAATLGGPWDASNGCSAAVRPSIGQKSAFARAFEALEARKTGGHSMYEAPARRAQNASPITATAEPSGR